MNYHMSYLSCFIRPTETLLDMGFMEIQNFDIVKLVVNSDSGHLDEIDFDALGPGL